MTKLTALIDKLDGQQQEACRMVAQATFWKSEGEAWADVRERYGVSPELMNEWRNDPAMKAKIEQLRYAMNLADGKGMNPKDVARRVLEAHAIEAAEKLVGIMQGKYKATPKQQLDATNGVLDRVGVFVGQKSTQFVIQVTQEDVRQMRASAIELGLAKPEEFEALPEPETNGGTDDA